MWSEFRITDIPQYLHANSMHNINTRSYFPPRYWPRKYFSTDGCKVLGKSVKARSRSIAYARRMGGGCWVNVGGGWDAGRRVVRRVVFARGYCRFARVPTLPVTSPLAFSLPPLQFIISCTSDFENSNNFLLPRGWRAKGVSRRSGVAGILVLV